MQSTPFLTPSFYHWHPRIEAPWAVLSQLQGLQHGDLTLTKQIERQVTKCLLKDLIFT